MDRMASIAALSATRESQTFDRKSVKIAAKDLATHIVAFANAGGTLLIGVADNGSIEGIDGCPEHVNDLLRVPFDLCIPSIRVSTKMLECVDSRGKPNHLLCMEVPSSPHLHTTTQDEAFYRIGDSSKKLSFDERQQLQYDKGEMLYEDKSVMRANWDDIDLEKVRPYLQKIGYTKTSEEYLKENGSFVLEENGKVKISGAAILLFGKAPQRFFPRARVRFIRYDGDEALTGAQMNVVKDEIFEGTVLEMLQQSLAFVQTQIKEHTYLGPEARFVTIPQYPPFVWKELIINAIAHRDYSIYGTDIQIKMYDSRLVVESPGKLPGIVRLNNLRHVHFSRNPKIAAFLKSFEYVREFGEGIDRMYREMDEAGLPAPEYESVAFMLKGYSGLEI